MEHLERARALVEDAEPSPAKARVAGTVARFLMIAGEADEAVRFGGEALAMAEELGLSELHAHALDVIGSARANAGDPVGFEDLERSVALAAAANAPHELCRALNNLGAVQVTWGELARSRDSYLRVREIAERFGQETFLRWTRAAVVVYGYYFGDWDQAVHAADEFLEAVDEGDPHYDAVGCSAIRSRIRFARGDIAGASTDAARAVELGRRAKDPQALYEALIVRAHVAVTGPAGEVARGGVDEVIRGLGSGVSFGGVTESLPTLAWVMRGLGRADELLSVLPASLPFRWATAARAVVAAEFARTAEICAQIGSKPDEAYARLRAAEQLVSEGRPANADEHLQLALTFWRSVGATRYVREGEGLLAATG